MELAKSTGESLVEHSQRVSNLAVSLFDILEWNESDPNGKERIREQIRKASLLHDIGKVVKAFQNSLKINESKKGVHFHHEIGWAFLSNHTTLDEIVLDGVYWHHGINNKMSSYTDIEVLNNKKNKITDKDILSMREFVINVGLGEYLRDLEDVEYCSSVKSPCYWEKDDKTNKAIGKKKAFIRAYVISADRFISSVGYPECPLKMAEDIISCGDISLGENKYKGKRFNNQLAIAKAGEEGTAIFNAPAGFGKTVVGLLWWLQGKGKKLIWVAPRNAVATSLYYNSIKNDIASLGIDCSVELYLGGSVIESTHNSVGFDSDIIITNIDNFSQPSLDNSTMDRLYMIYHCDVIFDEYHEFCQGGNALYACFISLMRQRHLMTQSRTALLSATPMGMDTKILSNFPNEKQVTFFPDHHVHYKAAHNKKFRLRVIDGDIPNIKSESSSIVYFNAVSNCQRYKRDNPELNLIHAQFESKDRNDIVKEIYDLYGKGAELNYNKKSIISSNLTQASFDVSFYRVYESVLSPQDTMQRMGRLNRWGTWGGTPEFHCYFHQNGDQYSAEDTLRTNFYDRKLTEEWFNHLLPYNGNEITLDQMYEIYNDFRKKFSSEETRVVLSSLNASTEYLSKIHPNKRHKGSFLSNEVFHADGNKIRKNGMGIFFICRHVNGGYSEAFSKSIYEGKFAEAFDEDRNSEKMMKKVIIDLYESNDPRFDFSEIYKKMNINTSTEENRGSKLVDKPYLQQAAKFSNTPYYAHNYKYHPDFGYIKENILNQSNQ